jgi:hypothetical protein
MRNEQRAQRASERLALAKDGQLVLSDEELARLMREAHVPKEAELTNKRF